MSARIELRKCAICHESFGRDGTTRYICNGCKCQSAPSFIRNRNDRDSFFKINHSKKLLASA